MQLTKFTDYSLRVLMYLSNHTDNLCTINEIAKWHNISKAHLVKIVHNLAKLGYIKTIQGKDGGLSLNKTAREINIGQLIRDTEPNFYITECFNKEENGCRITKACKLKHILSEATNQFLKVLDKHTLDSINF